MDLESLKLLNLLEALGIGLLIGAERERSLGHGPSRPPAGIRTFAIASLAGAVSMLTGGELLLGIAVIGMFTLMGLAYWRSRKEDAGLTTEVALPMTVLLGGFSIIQPELAAAIGIVVAILLAARVPLRTFVRSAITEDELWDGLVLAAATLVVLPVIPDRPMGPYAILNPYTIWIVAILVMAIGAAGHVSIRVFGARYGLPLTGLASGSISSTAVVGAMGDRATKAPNLVPAAAAGASLSSIATIVQMALILAATSMATLRTLAFPLIAAGIAATIYGAASTILALRQRIDEKLAGQRQRPFSITKAVLFSLTLAAILVASAALQQWLGQAGVLLAAALAGILNTHSAAIAVAFLVATGTISPADTLWPILSAILTNTVVKIVLAGAVGNFSFAIRVIPGLVLVMLAAWAGAYYSNLQ